MRKGLAISGLLHLLVLAWAFGFFPGPERLRPTEVKAVPIDLVTPSELTKIKAGLRDRKNANAAPKPKKKARKSATKKAKPKQKAARPKSLPKSKPRPQPKSAAREPKAKPVKAPKKRADKAALDKLVSKALKERPPKAPAPRKKPAKSFNADRIAALLNKVPDAGEKSRAASKPKPKPVPQAKGRPSGQDQQLTISEIDALRARISQCWAPPTGATGAAALKVKLRLNLNRDGTLARQPQIMNSGRSTFFQVAADSAVRAVWQCQPYELPAGKYALWRDMVLNFDPREMFGG